MNRSLTAGILALSSALVVSLAAPAIATLNDVERRGNCSGHSEWRLKASPDDGRIRVEGRVDANAGGQTWRWRMLHNGSVSAKGTATTGGSSESFEVRRLMVNAAGTDRIGWRTRNPQSGETCRGNLNF